MTEQEDVLAGEILADARKRAERILQRAEREARGVVAEARQSVETENQASIANAEQEVARQRRVADARGEQDAAALRRDVRADAIEAVRGRARERLAQLPDGEDYEDLLVGLALSAIERMTGGEFQLLLRPRDRDRFAATLPFRVAAGAGRDIRVEVAPETITGMGGLIVRGAGGRQVADQTFEARLERLWGELRQSVARVLPAPAEDARQ